MIYWKDILVDVERMLDAAAGAATLLQNFLCGYNVVSFYELILDFSYNLCIIKVHGGNAMAVDVRPSSRFDDYFPDYQFGCG